MKRAILTAPLLKGLTTRVAPARTSFWGADADAEVQNYEDAAASLSGTTSPYPTVVMVMMAMYRQSSQRAPSMSLRPTVPTMVNSSSSPVTISTCRMRIPRNLERLRLDVASCCHRQESWTKSAVTRRESAARWLRARVSARTAVTIISRDGGRSYPACLPACAALDDAVRRGCGVSPDFEKRQDAASTMGCLARCSPIFGWSGATCLTPLPNGTTVIPSPGSASPEALSLLEIP